MTSLDPNAVLYEDNHLLVLNKEPGLLTQPVPSDSRDSLEDLAKTYLKQKYNKPGRVFLHAVHRIDRQVSGLVIFARTDKALSRLNQAMRERRIVKIYHALVEGEATGAPGETIHLRHYLSHQSHVARVSRKQLPGSREATLAYSVLKKGEELSLLEVYLDTGRYHQIRAQLAFAGHPVLGDRKYGAASGFDDGTAIGLHSRNSRFPHPVRNETLDLLAPYPPFWRQIAKDLIS